MGLFSSFFGCNKSENDKQVATNSPTAESTEPFVLEQDYKKNRANQLAMAPMTLEQLRKLGIDDSSFLKLEYFFYTNAQNKAKLLADELSQRGYSGGHDVAAGDSSQFVITGWTTPLQMTDDIVAAWTGEMCDLGYNFDCDFDGWGTNPNQ